MATLTVRYRRPKKTSCKDCGCPDLQWVATGQDDSKKTDVNPQGWIGYHYVPFGTDDFSGKIHPIVPCGGNSSYAQNTVAVTPTTTASAIGGFPPAASSVDLGPIEARLDGAEQAIAAFQPGITKLTDIISDTSGRMDTKLGEMKAELAKAAAARPVTLSAPWVPTPVALGRVHAATLNAIAMVAAIGHEGVVTLVGEAASGKSTVARKIADGLGSKALHRMTLHEYTTAPDVFGFKSPVDGKYHPSEMWYPYVNGGSGFIDEINRASPEGASMFNGLTSGDETGWPDGTHKKHADCYFFAAANNYCRGADVRYNATTQLDFATLTRLVFLPMPTDWAMLGDIYGSPIKGDAYPFKDPGPARTNSDPLVKAWGQLVKNVFDEVNKQDINAAISARAFIAGVLMLRAGIDYDLIQFSTIWSKMDADSADQIKTNLGLKK